MLLKYYIIKYRYVKYINKFLLIYYIIMSSNKSKALIKKYYDKIKKMTYKEIYNQLLETDEDTIKYKLLNRRLKFLKNNKQEKVLKSLEKESINVLDNLLKQIYSIEHKKTPQYKVNNRIQNNQIKNVKQVKENNDFIKPYVSDSYGGFASYP